MSIVQGGQLPEGYTYVAPRAALPVQHQPGLLQIRTQYTVNPDTGNHAENVLWFTSDNTVFPTAVQLTEIQNVFDPAWGSMFLTYGATSQQYTGSVITDWSNPTGIVQSSVGHFTAVSGGSGGLCTRNIALLVSLQTAEHYRGGRGRIYLPEVGTGCLATDPDQITGTIQTNVSSRFATVMSNMQNSSILGGQTLQVYRNRTGKTGTPTLRLVIGFLVQLFLASQRRRLRKAPHK